MTLRKSADLRLLEGRSVKNSPKPTPIAPNEPTAAEWGQIMGNAASAKLAASFWADTVPELERLGLATVLDGAALTELCVVWARLRECERELGREGLLVDGYRGSRVKNPVVTVATQYRAALGKLMHSSGLTAAARQQLDVAKPNDGPSAIEEIIAANRRT